MNIQKIYAASENDDRYDEDDEFELAVEQLTEKGAQFYPFGPDNILEWMDAQEGMVDDVASIVRIAWENMAAFAKLPGALDAMQSLSHDLESYWTKKAVNHLITPEPY